MYDVASFRGSELSFERKSISGGIRELANFELDYVSGGQGRDRQGEFLGIFVEATVFGVAGAAFGPVGAAAGFGGALVAGFVTFAGRDIRETQIKAR
ncbi:MAG: hypothetical protein AAF498_08460 [Pseudomonadota bacterium]